MKKILFTFVILLSILGIWPACKEVQAAEDEGYYIIVVHNLYDPDFGIFDGAVSARCWRVDEPGTIIEPSYTEWSGFEFENLKAGIYEYEVVMRDKEGSEFTYTSQFDAQKISMNGEGYVYLRGYDFTVDSESEVEESKKSKGFTVSMYRTLPNDNVENVEPIRFIQAEGSDYYQKATYILEQHSGDEYSSISYHYDINAVDPELILDSYDLTGSVSSISSGGYIYKRVKFLEPEYFDLKVNVPGDLGSEVKIYDHRSNLAYAPQEEVKKKSVSSNQVGDTVYQNYSFQVPIGSNKSYDIVSGGEETGYKKTVVIFEADPKDVGEKREAELFLDMEKKGTPTKYRVEKGQNDLYTNVKNGYLPLKEGQRKRIEGFRMDQTTADAVSNRLTEPDIVFTPVYGKDKIKMEKTGSFGREGYMIEAVEGASGIAVLKVTYDELNIGSSYSLEDELRYVNYPAIDDGNVGVIVVDIGEDNSSLATGLKLYSHTEKGEIDFRSDFDTVYIPNIIEMPNGEEEVNESGTTEYRFTPPEGSTVRIHEPIHKDTEAITDDEWITPEISEGKAALHLKEGRNIVEIENNGKKVYATLNARKLNVTIENQTHPGETPITGDELRARFTGLRLPVYKMATIYNPGWISTTDSSIYVEYLMSHESEKDEKTYLEGLHSQYAIATRNAMDFTVEKSGRYTLSNGQIHGTHMGSGLWAHTAIGLKGQGANLNAGSVKSYPDYCILPDITLEVQGTVIERTEALIDKINKEHPLETVREIMEAEKAFRSLTKSQQKNVNEEKRKILENAYAAVEHVIDVIEKIDRLPESGDVTGQDIKKINLVNTDYLDLSPEERQAVDNYSPKMESLMGLVNSVKAVEDLITAIPEESALTLNDAQKVTDAVKAYNELDPVLVSAVDSRGRLPGLEKKIGDLTAAREVDDAIGAIGTVTAENYKSGEIQAAILQAKNLQARLTEAQKGLVTKARILEDAEKAVEQFRQAEPAREIQAIMDQISVLRTQEDGTPGPLSQVNSQETWKSWEGYVKNIRKAVDRLSAEQKGKITNISDLELAENCILSGNTGYAEKLIGSLPSEGEAAQRPLTEEELSAVAAAMDTYNSLTREEKAKLTPEMVKKLNELNQKAASQSTDGSYQKKMAEGFARQADEYFSLNKDGATSRTQIEDARKLVDQYEAYPADSRAVLDAMQDSQGVTYGQRMANLKAQTEALENEVQETEDLNRQISELPVIVDIDNADALLEDIAGIEQRYGNLSADGKSYVDLAVPNVLKGIAQSMKAEIEAFQAGAVAGVKASAASYNKVRLQWNSSSQAKSYIIQRKAGSGEWEDLKTTGALSCTDNSVKTGTAYVYRVCAVSARWGDTEVQSQYGESGSVKPALSAAVLSKVQASGKRALKITWKRVNGASGYEIYRSTSKNGKFKKVKTLARGSATSFTNKNLSRNKAYYYKVRAYRKVDKKNVAGAFSGVKGAKTRKK